VNNEAVDRLLKNYISTVRINFNSASQITVTAGEIVCSNTAATVRKFRSNPSSTTVTWTNIDTGSEENSKTYYVYALADTDAETFTCKITLSSSYPSGATYYKKIGSFYNNDAGTITSIANDADPHEFGAWVDKSSSYGAQQATTDGVVLARATLGNDDSTGIKGYTDSNADPSSMKAQATAGSTGVGVVVTISMPVKRGDYWKITSTQTPTVWWIPTSD
jgi:hypothetical protein